MCVVKRWLCSTAQHKCVCVGRGAPNTALVFLLVLAEVNSCSRSVRLDGSGLLLHDKLGSLRFKNLEEPVTLCETHGEISGR